jgi:hypothetical protein
LVVLELAELDALDFDLSLTGFDPFEIDDFLFPDAVEASAEKVPDLPKIAVTRLGRLVAVPLTPHSRGGRDVARGCRHCQRERVS